MTLSLLTFLKLQGKRPREKRTAAIDAIHIESRKTNDGGGGNLRDRDDGANFSPNEDD